MISILRRFTDKIRRRQDESVATRFLVWKVEGAGLRVLGDDVERVFLSWHEIAEIVAYKRDLYTVDQVCVAFRVRGAEDFFALEEDNPSWEVVLAATNERFDLLDGWFAEVDRDAFQTNWKTIWGNSEPNANA